MVLTVKCEFKTEHVGVVTVNDNIHRSNGISGEVYIVGSSPTIIAMLFEKVYGLTLGNIMRGVKLEYKPV